MHIAPEEVRASIQRGHLVHDDGRPAEGILAEELLGRRAVAVDRDVVRGTFLVVEGDLERLVSGRRERVRREDQVVG